MRWMNPMSFAVRSVVPPAGVGRAIWRPLAMLAVAAGFALQVAGLAHAALSDDDIKAVSTWGPPIVSAVPSATNLVSNQTLRQIARISAGGNKVRVRLTNRWNTLPLDIGAATVALRSNDQNVDAASIREVTFGGAGSFTIPAGGELLSDWVDLPVPDLADVAVDIYLPGDTSVTGTVLSVRNGALQTNYLSTSGNFVGSTTFPVGATRTIWQFFSGIDVVASRRMTGIVAFGDSITEGLNSLSNGNRRWPDQLARRLVAAGEAQRRGVVNAGISGNRVGVGGGSTNPSALARFDRDVLARTDVKYVVVLLGINDLNGGATADDVIANLRQVITRARTHQLKIYGGTVTPFGNSSAAVEAGRLVVNDWIRNSREFDGIVDFDLAIRDPNNPRRILAAYDSGDSLHPSSLGYDAMGNAVDLSLFGSD